MMVLLFFIQAAIVAARSVSDDLPVHTIEDGKSIQVLHATEGYVISPGFNNGTGYPVDVYGSVTLTAAAPNKYVVLYFEHVDLDAHNYCGGDRLEVWDKIIVSERKALVTCGSHRPRPWRSFRNTAKIVFKSDFMLAGGGFRIRYRATADGDDLCDMKTEFQCTNRQCISFRGVCDGVIDCADASDEKLCVDAAAKALKNIPDVPCGAPVFRPRTESEDRMVGGQEAVPHSWPWQVSLSEAGYEVMGHFCGGTLIASQWVLTAAHCLRDRTPKELVILIGAHDLLNVSDVVTRRVETFVIHDKYGRLNTNHDIALVKLDMPVNFTESVRPACLPADDDLLQNGRCFATGWGETRGTGSFAKLKQVEMAELPFEGCKKTRWIFRDFEEQHTFCAGDKHGENGVCHGDSGGPLFCSKDGASWTVQGVANLIMKSTELGTVCGLGSDAFWNRVSASMPWIRRTMRSV